MAKLNFKASSTKTITFFYFFLLIYTIAALVWWGLLLYQQNQEIVGLKMEILELEKFDVLHKKAYTQKLAAIRQQNKIRNLQYFGEGGAFLVIILVSAGYVYRAVRKQVRFARQQQNFMLAVTHELKSPIAVLRLNIETLLKRKLPEEQQQNLLSKTLLETDRLNRLSNNMLLASQFENRQYHLVRESLNLSELFSKIADETKQRTKKQSIVADIAAGIVVEGDPLMLQIVCSNLIENALKYAPTESTIDLTLTRHNNEARLQVKDQGTGISPEEKNKIFTRFYRIGNENTRRTQGTGLGLFLTKKIVLQLGGRINVMDNTPKGSIFEITLPLADKKAMLSDTE